MYKTADRLIKSVASLAVIAVVMLANSNVVYADCEENYGGGETCDRDRAFKIVKEVRIAGDEEWEDKITDVKKGDVIEFRIQVKNVGEVSVDDMEMIDKLPDELKKFGGAGLTEEWDNFGEGTTKEFIITVTIDEDEFDRTGNFDKCVVNKASAYFDDEFVGADTATVCYGNGEPTELPKTGAESTVLSIYGLSLVGLGLFLTKKGYLA